MMMKWSGKARQRFEKLSREESIRELSVEEIAELEHLTRLRRQAKNRRTADEILRERKQQRSIIRLISAIETRLRLSAFEQDWNAPGMEAYDTPNDQQTKGKE